MGIRAGYYANKVWKDHNDVTKDQTYDLSVPECGLSRALFHPWPGSVKKVRSQKAHCEMKPTNGGKARRHGHMFLEEQCKFHDFVYMYLTSSAEPSCSAYIPSKPGRIVNLETSGLQVGELAIMDFQGSNVRRTVPDHLWLDVDMG
jgi:hypothetical protein